jgi:glycerol uptake facilitator-like aquaporin
MAGLVEGAGAFILVFAYFATTVDPRAPKIAGLGIGLALAGIVLVIGPLTGGAVNPARYLGSAIWEAGLTSFEKFRGEFAVYIAGPILGAIAAGWLYTGYILPKDGEKK